MGTGSVDPNNLTLLRPDGAPVRLGDLHAGPVLLVFFRHLT
jgi:hypothetical protein